MARMTRELTLVLLGSGLLSMGYFLWPEDDPAQKAEDAANGGGQGGAARSGRSHVVFFVRRGSSSPRSYARTTTVRGGFGRTGIGISGG
jgi:hypothetical protein